MVAPENKNGIIAYRFQAVCGMTRAFTRDDNYATRVMLINSDKSYKIVTLDMFLTSRSNLDTKLPEIRY